MRGAAFFRAAPLFLKMGTWFDFNFYLRITQNKLKGKDYEQKQCN